VNIPKVKFPKINIDLPRLNLKPLHINLKPDLKGLKEVRRISEEVRAEVNSSAKKAAEVYSTGWKWFKVIMVLFALWLLSICVTIFEAMWNNIFRGWRMLLGQEAKEID
jgi:hypothetical protein